MGVFLKNARAAARKAQEIEQRRAEGLPVESSVGALSDERREQLEEIDASWCPSWPVTWQRCFHLVRMHLDANEALPTEAGDVVRQGEDLGRWVQSVRFGWDELTAVQQWMCEQVLGIEPATEDEKPKRRTQADKWAMNYEAAKQFYEREGYLQAAADHDITVDGPNLAAQAIEAGLGDEYHLFITTSVVGGGKRFFPDGVHLDLDLVEERAFGSGLIYARYRAG